MSIIRPGLLPFFLINLPAIPRGIGANKKKQRNALELYNSMRPTLLLTTLALFAATGFSQTRCDTTSKDIWTFLEHPPQATITDADLELKLNSLIAPTALDKYHADYLYVTFFVNCNGE